MFRGKGFTLVEVLVVLVIIGILVALILPNALRAINQANTKDCASNIRTIDTAIQMFYSEKRAWPDAVAVLAPYLADGAIPKCRLGGGDYALDATGQRCDRAKHFTVDNWPNTHD